MPVEEAVEEDLVPPHHAKSSPLGWRSTLLAGMGTKVVIVKKFLQLLEFCNCKLFIEPIFVSGNCK